MSADTWLDRYEHSLLGVFGRPGLVLSHGEGCYVVDVDGRRYLDLLGGIAVNALGHNHPALVSAISKQAGAALHVSNFFTTPAQIELAERLLTLAGAGEAGRVFLCNSGAEAIEGAIKVARRTGRTEIVAAEGAFHGRTTGALALTAKAAYREPFEPLIPGVVHVPYADVSALEAAVTDATSAIVLEPIQGEAGVIVPGADYLRAARQIADRHGALLIVDEIQTGVGRTGRWFAHQESGIVPDVMTLAKGLAGGVPIGAVVTLTERASSLLTAGQHGSTFGGNPLAAAAALAVLDEIAADDLLTNATRVGRHLVAAVDALGDERIVGVRGEGLLRAIALRDDVAAPLAVAARDAGFIVNAPTPNALRLAPPLIITEDEIDTFVSALPALLDRLAEAQDAITSEVYLAGHRPIGSPDRLGGHSHTSADADSPKDDQ